MVLSSKLKCGIIWARNHSETDMWFFPTLSLYQCAFACSATYLLSRCCNIDIINISVIINNNVLLMGSKKCSKLNYQTPNFTFTKLVIWTVLISSKLKELLDIESIFIMDIKIMIFISSKQVQGLHWQLVFWSSLKSYCKFHELKKLVEACSLFILGFLLDPSMWDRNYKHIGYVRVCALKQRKDPLKCVWNKGDNSLKYIFQECVPLNKHLVTTHMTQQLVKYLSYFYYPDSPFFSTYQDRKSKGHNILYQL